jgi:hypothetical protein
MADERKDRYAQALAARDKAEEKWKPIITAAANKRAQLERDLEAAYEEVVKLVQDAQADGVRVNTLADLARVREIVDGKETMRPITRQAVSQMLKRDAPSAAPAPKRNGAKEKGKAGAIVASAFA